MIRSGYCIPLIPGIVIPPACFHNSKLALRHSQFVEFELRALLASGAVRTVATRPKGTSPLSVADNGSKLRLILDLSWFNQFVLENRLFAFNRENCTPFWPRGGYMGSFDFRSGYHHVDVRPEYQQYLGFSGVFDGRITFFVFYSPSLWASFRPALF